MKWKRGEDCFMVRHSLLLAVVCEVKRSGSATFKHIRNFCHFFDTIEDFGNIEEFTN